MMAQPTIVPKERSVVLLTARMDGASLFDGLVPGAMSPVTSIVTLLTVSSYLKSMGAFNLTKGKLNFEPSY